MPPQPVAHSSIPHPLLQLLEEVQDVDEGRDVSLRGSQKPEHKEPLVVLRDVEDAKPVSDLRSLIRPNPQSISGWPSRSEGTEGRGLEPRSARARRFSSSPERLACGCVWFDLPVITEKEDGVSCV